jgi:hypothetical protein
MIIIALLASTNTKSLTAHNLFSNSDQSRKVIQLLAPTFLFASPASNNLHSVKNSARSRNSICTCKNGPVIEFTYCRSNKITTGGMYIFVVRLNVGKFCRTIAASSAFIKLTVAKSV